MGSVRGFSVAVEYARGDGEISVSNNTCLKGGNTIANREVTGDFRSYFSLAVLYGTDTRMASDTK